MVLCSEMPSGYDVPASSRLWMANDKIVGY